MNRRKRFRLWLFGCEFRGMCKLYAETQWACTEGSGGHCGMKRRLDEGRYKKTKRNF